MSGRPCSVLRAPAPRHAFQFRLAEPDDLDFATAALIEAERSGADSTMYERALAVLPTELAPLLRALIAEDIPGSELCLSSFLLALDAGAPVGCIATWIEADGNAPSRIVRTNMLAYALGAERWRQAQPQLARLSAIDIPREPGTLQIEAVYTAPSHRGRGVIRAVIEDAIERCRAEHPTVRKAQILSVVANEPSARAFAKSGFTATRRTHSDDPAVTALFPGTGRILWEREL